MEDGRLSHSLLEKATKERNNCSPRRDRRTGEGVEKGIPRRTIEGVEKEEKRRDC